MLDWCAQKGMLIVTKDSLVELAHLSCKEGLPGGQVAELCGPC